MSSSPWTRPDQSAPPMPEVVLPGEGGKGLSRLRRYANLIHRSAHFKYNVARFLSRLLPDVASGIIRGRIYRWAGFDIGAGAFIMGNLRLTSAAPDFYSKLSIGEGATLADGITINLDDKVTIEEGAWVRVGAILVPGVTVGRGSIVAAGAVVLKDVPPNTYVEGNPAQVVRQLPWGYR